MAWLRARLRAAHHRFPGVGYGVALFVCLVLILSGVLPWEWGFFVLWPGLNALCHVVAPREVWGGRAYRTLAGVWLGAAVLGVLAHWRALDPYTPWLSLGRYLLFLAALFAGQLSVLTGHPQFSAREDPRVKKRASVKAVVVSVVVLQILCMGLVSHLIPLEVAIAPRYRGLRAERVWSAPGDEVVYRMAWSPDSRYLVADATSGIWVLDPAQHEATRIPERGYLSSRPWLVSGDGLLLKRREDDGGGIWLAAPPDWKAELVDGSPRLGIPRCSPTQEQVALVLPSAEAEECYDIWLMKADWSERRLFVQDGWGPVWSADGKHIVFFRLTGEVEEEAAWIADLAGHTTRLPVPLTPRAPFAGGFDWLSEDRFVTTRSELETEEGVGLLERLLPRLGGDAQASVWDLQGNELASLRVRTALPVFGLPVAAARQRADRVALGTGLTGFLPGAADACFLWDLGSDKLWRVRVGLSDVSALAWSPDGDTLAISGSSFDFEPDWRRDPLWQELTALQFKSGIWLVTGW